MFVVVAAVVVVVELSEISCASESSGVRSDWPVELPNFRVRLSWIGENCRLRSGPTGSSSERALKRLNPVREKFSN